MDEHYKKNRAKVKAYLAKLEPHEIFTFGKIMLATNLKYDELEPIYKNLIKRKVVRFVEGSCDNLEKKLK